MDITVEWIDAQIAQNSKRLLTMYAIRSLIIEQSEELEKENAELKIMKLRLKK